MVKGSRRSPLAAAAWFLMLLAGPGVVAAQAASAAAAGRVASLSQARTLCVEPFTGSAQAGSLREELVRRLSKRFRIVASPRDADAIVEGTGQIWVRGYTSANPRAPATNLQAVYGGYLSLEVVGADGQPLWSWLATPGRMAWNGIVDDLAGHAAKQLLEAASGSSTGSPSAASSGALAETTLAGGGATFPAPLYRKWFQDFAQLHPGVTVRYTPLGSELGVERMLGGQLDFAGSDVALEVVSAAPAASQLRRVASVLGAVVPIYNVRGVTRDLRFTPEALADIYLGRVRRWNDEEIRRSNRGVELPDAPIAVIHRSDGSGTTWVWSDFLSRVSPGWAAAAGRGVLLRWPVGTGAEHNEGVADTVEKTPNSIGYVELAYAIQNQLSYGAVRNRAGVFVHADLDSLAEAARGAGAAGIPAAAITDPPDTSAYRNAYPIAAFTWLLLPAQSADPARRAALRELLRWVLTSGQKDCSALGYAPLPQDIAESELRALDAWP